MFDLSLASCRRGFVSPGAVGQLTFAAHPRFGTRHARALPQAFADRGRADSLHQIHMPIDRLVYAPSRGDAP